MRLLGANIVRRVVLLLVLLAAPPAQAEWWEAKTDHVIVYSESSSREARDFAEKLTLGGRRHCGRPVDHYGGL